MKKHGIVTISTHVFNLWKRLTQELVEADGKEGPKQRWEEVTKALEYELDTARSSVSSDIDALRQFIVENDDASGDDEKMEEEKDG